MDFTPVLELSETLALCHGNTRPFVEGSEVTSHGVMCIGHTMQTENFAVGDDIIRVFALVMQASHSDEIPHVVKISIKRMQPHNKVVKSWCSCLAGQGTCKHIMASCMRLFRLTEEMLEPISCTDTVQQWSKCNMKKWSNSMFHGTRLDNMCHFTQSKSDYDSALATDEAFGSRVRDLLTEDGDHASELARFMRKNRCTKPSSSVRNLHKSMKKAIVKVQTCPIMTPSLPTKGRRGNKVANSFTQQAKDALAGDKENVAVNASPSSETPAKAPTESSTGRRPLGSIQPSATPTGPPTLRARYDKIRQGRLPPPPPVMVSPAFVSGLVKQPLPKNLTPSCIDSMLDKADEEYFISEVCLTPEAAIQLCLSTTSQSSTPVWKEARKKRFTASKCYQLFTPKTPLDNGEFWQQKVKGVHNGTFSGNFSTQRGLEDEVYARRRYEEVYGYAVKTIGLVVHPDLPWLACSPDGVIEDRVLFETKSHDSGILNSACDIVRNLQYVKIAKNGDMTLSSRHPFYGQVQMNMALTGLRMCHFVIYASSDNSIVTIKVPYDEVFAVALVDKLTKLYFRYYLRILRDSDP